MKHVRLMGNNTLTACVVVIHRRKCVIEVPTLMYITKAGSKIVCISSALHYENIKAKYYIGISKIQNRKSPRNYFT